VLGVIFILTQCPTAKVSPVTKAIEIWLNQKGAFKAPFLV